MNKNVMCFTKKVALMIILFLGINIIVTNLELILGIGINAVAFWIALIVPMLAIVSMCFKEQNKWEWLVAIICYLCIIVLALNICSNIYSDDWDGNVYHKFAVGFLKNGWNPLKESSEDFGIRFFGKDILDGNELWIDHYGKASWLFASSVYCVTNNIESGKAYTLIAMCALFCLLYAFLKERQYSWPKTMIVCFLLVFNPIALSQMLTYYVDGYMGIMLYILLICLTMEFEKKESKCIVEKVAIFCTMIVLGNIKFTGLLYGGIFCIVYYLVFWMQVFKQDKIRWISMGLRKGIYFFCVAVTTILFVGFPTYVTNFLQHGSFTYPLSGYGKVDIISSNQPIGFNGMNTLYKLFYSLFSRTENLGPMLDKTLPTLKLPFEVYESEVTAITDGVIAMRIGGFGVFFGLIVLFSIITIGEYLFEKRKSADICIKIILFASAMMAVLISESWWARYSPYIFLIGILGILIIYKRSDMKSNVIAIIISIIFLINNSMFGVQIANVVENSKLIEQEFVQANQYEKIYVARPYFGGILFDLMDWNIEYEMVDSIDERQCMTLYYEHIKYKGV